jgi:hypothetical protein
MSHLPPADLDVEVGKLLDEVTSARRKLVEVRQEYSRLDASTLAVDEPGDPIEPADALSAACDALADVDRALGLSVDAIYTAMRAHISALRAVVQERYMVGERFRHTAQFNRWRPDRDPARAPPPNSSSRSRSA